ncbi:MAG: O-antigen ligase family protein [Pseudomonadota bacterium]
MITLDQAAAIGAPRRSGPASLPSPGAPARKVPAVAITLLHGALFLTILGSFLVFIEPSPYEVLSALLAFTCFLAAVPVDRKLLPLVILLLLYNLGGAFSLIPVINDEASRRFVMISFYMAFTAIIFAMIFSQDCVRRAEILRRAYIVAGVCAALAGIVGYFKGIDLLTLYGRARGTFKDPNVYGPFLVLPMLFLMQSFLLRGLRVLATVAFLIMAAGLFLSFSRAAWAHMVFSAAMMVALLFVTTPNGWFRARLIAFSVMTSLAVTGLLLGLLAVGNVGTVFKERASLNQYYDRGESGRFGNQKKSVGQLIERPNGYGPLQFRYYFPNDPHQVYLNAFASYGWLGGFSYLSLVLITLAVGLRSVLVRTPWQPYFIAVMSTYTGVSIEGLVIDTDHWRHYYLLLGLVWGFSIATMNYVRRAALHTPA